MVADAVLPGQVEMDPCTELGGNSGRVDYCYHYYSRPYIFSHSHEGILQIHMLHLNLPQ